MIVVDSTVWIDFLRGRNAPHVRRLDAMLGITEIIVGDLMLCEVLQGLDGEREAREVEALLRRFEVVPWPEMPSLLPQPATSVPYAVAESPYARPSTC